MIGDIAYRSSIFVALFLMLERVFGKCCREDAALGRMIAKHGDDYEKMARDISLNYLQWTATKLRKKCERRNKIKKMEKRL